MNSLLPDAFLHPLHTTRPLRSCPASKPRPMTVRSAAQEGGEEQTADVCPTCGISNASKPKGCDGQGRIAGGLGAVVGWFPIKAYRPCPAAVKGNFAYTRKGQITDEVLFGKGKQKRSGIPILPKHSHGQGTITQAIADVVPMSNPSLVRFADKLFAEALANSRYRLVREEGYCAASPLSSLLGLSKGLCFEFGPVSKIPSWLELDDVIYKLKTVSRVRRVTHRTVTGGSMAHSVNCKLLHSYRRWNSFQKQPLHKDCRKLRVTCANNGSPGEDGIPATVSTRRAILQTGPALLGMHLMLQASPAQAVGFKKDMARRRGFKAQIPEEDFQTGPQGLKYYDVTPGKGALPKKGDRIAVHYEIRWHGVTFMTSRQGMGVTGGEPLGFNLGAQGPGGTLPGLDLAVQAGEGMRVGGARKAILPPELGYGEKGIGEIPGGATLELDVELLSVKTSPFGSRVKLVEG